MSIMCICLYFCLNFLSLLYWNNQPEKLLSVMNLIYSTIVLPMRSIGYCRAFFCFCNVVESLCFIGCLFLFLKSFVDFILIYSFSNAC